jgi:mannonate dehydratase
MSLRRRSLLHALRGGSVLALSSPRLQKPAHDFVEATRGIPPSKIKDISVKERQPAEGLTDVRITTDQDGLYGNGCGTFHPES